MSLLRPGSLKQLTETSSTGTPCVNLWLITELCNLGNLKSFAYDNELSFGKKVDIMHQCAVALDHLHGNR